MCVSERQIDAGTQGQVQSRVQRRRCRVQLQNHCTRPVGPGQRACLLRPVQGGSRETGHPGSQRGSFGPGALLNQGWTRDDVWYQPFGALAADGFTQRSLVGK